MQKCCRRAGEVLQFNESGMQTEMIRRKKDLDGIETERRFLIKMPPETRLGALGGDSIVQTYIESEKGVSERVRARTHEGKTTYTHTKKRRISEVSSFEDERVIDGGEYAALADRRESGTSPIKKTRYVLPYRGLNFEIDVYPQWRKTAVMEVELPREDSGLELPPEIEVIREITGERMYSNHAMSRSFPDEPLSAEE